MPIRAQDIVVIVPSLSLSVAQKVLAYVESHDGSDDRRALDDGLRHVGLVDVSILTDSVNDPESHRHRALVDEDTGSGVTSFDAGHRHVVSEWKVLPSGRGGHTHSLQRDTAVEDTSGEETAEVAARDMAQPLVIFCDLSDQSGLEVGEDKLVVGKPIQIAKTGTFIHPRHGKFSITTENLKELVENFDKLGRDVYVDYQHLAGKIVGGDPRETSKAAGWLGRVWVTDDGARLMAEPKWTERGYEAVVSKEFRYTSPEFDRGYTNDDGTALGWTLLGVALTNTPFLKGMEPIAASEQVPMIALTDAADGEPLWREPKMNKLAKLFGLPENATDEEVEVAAKERIADGDASSEGLKAALTAAGVDEAEVVSLTETPDVKAIAAAVPEQPEEKEDDDESDGTVRLSEEEFTKLKEGAEAGVEARTELRERDAHDRVVALSRAGKVVGKAAREWAEKFFLSAGEKAFGEWASTLTANKEAAILATEIGHGDGSESTVTHENAAIALSEAVEKLQGDGDKTYDEAFDLVQKNEPELIRNYERAMTGSNDDV